MELAIERALDLSSYPAEELAARVRRTRVVIWPRTESDGNALVARLGLEKVRQIGKSGRSFTAEWREDIPIIEAFRKLNSIPEIKFAYPQVQIQIDRDDIPNDPLFAEQWHLRNTGQLNSIPEIKFAYPQVQIQTGY